MGLAVSQPPFLSQSQQAAKAAAQYQVIHSQLYRTLIGRSTGEEKTLSAILIDTAGYEVYAAARSLM